MRYVLADIRLLIIEILTHHIRELLTGNIGHNIENFLFEVLRGFDCPIIDDPFHIALLSGREFVSLLLILLIELTYVQYIDSIETILYKYGTETSQIFCRGG